MALDRELVNGLLDQLCRELGTLSAVLDEDGEATLQAAIEGETVQVVTVLQEQYGLLTLVAPVGRVQPSVAADRLGPLFLSLNLSAEDTAGLALALDPHERL